MILYFHYGYWLIDDVIVMGWTHSAFKVSRALITDIVKMYMWEFDAEKLLFDKIAGFLTAIV